MLDLKTLFTQDMDKVEQEEVTQEDAEVTISKDPELDKTPENLKEESGDEKEEKKRNYIEQAEFMEIHMSKVLRKVDEDETKQLSVAEILNKLVESKLCNIEI